MNNPLDGILIINKPQGYTSHDVVAIVRRVLKTRRVGHAGTLDPLATGVLVVLVGKSTRLFDQCVAFDKSYRSTLRLGIKTDSADITGKVIAQKDASEILSTAVKEAFDHYIGDILQLPPMVSAVKKNGRKLYELAREGKVIERTPRQVRIDAIDIIRMDLPEVEFTMNCSKGTYVRQLVDDVGDRLGCGACLTQIERTKVGPFLLEDALRLEEIDERLLRPFPVCV